MSNSENNKILAPVIDPQLKIKLDRARQQKYGIKDFIEEFLDSFLSEETKKAYLKDMNFFFSFIYKAGAKINHPSDIESHHFRLYRDHMINKNLAPATINRRLVCIRSFVKWAIAAKLMDHNPLDVVKLPRTETLSPTLAFSDDEVVQMINATNPLSFKGHSHRLMLIMLFSLGLRRSELVAITKQDIFQDRHHHVLKIRGKGKKIRYLPLTSQIYQELKHYFQHLENLGVSLDPSDYIFQSSSKRKQERPINGSTIFRMIQKYAKLIGINRRVSPHSCRATAISHLLDTQQTPIRDVATFAGHSQVTTTERYDKKRRGLDDSAAYQIDYKKQA